MKTTYIIKETQNVNSDRKGIKFESETLTQAKRFASRNQIFQGTTLKIEYENGSLVCFKESGNNWINA
ncbi:TPA: hypothetical protein SMQ11_003808 [Proteus mirabilis]|uniref:hypothetical protein n=1 Tax=Proteus mirabilis TaxID=584 RepID=UPI001BAFDFC2|nr:hypothetical protein [Proteus mirabilis]ELT0455824.1 hypothetical protein [Morganella morganii]EKW7428836.1 hypothetical protein [Proteus mirabilis]MBS3881227.1 hypothetical protein [Proteus mirabilis]MCT0093891.1 hypothetical protein [Proteus mirabilis]MDZ7491361.1 hypothetical protein [Proteus mirabilis]